MFTNITRNTSIPEFFTIGWFRFTIDGDQNYEVILILHDILVIMSFLTNPILLYIIIKTLPTSSGKNSSILIGNICVTNIIVSGFGSVKVIVSSVVDYGIMTRVMSIFLPMYYFVTFCLALNNFGLIVTPLKFQLYSPKPKTLIGILGFVWITVTLVLVIAPSLASDFNTYVKVMLTAIVALCWLAGIIVAIMYTKILLTLYQRKLTLHRTLNLSNSKQGLIVIKQNRRLATVLSFYTLVLVVFTLPFFTGILLILHCSECDNPSLVSFTLYALPFGMSIPIIHVFHWLIATTQYKREMKRLIKKALAFCVKKDTRG